MPLTKCPKCDGRVATVAARCPHCAYLLAEERRREAQGVEDIQCHKCRALIPSDLPVCCNCGVVDPRPYRPWLTPKVSATVVIALVVVGGGWTRLEPFSRWTHQESAMAETPNVLSSESAPDAAPIVVTRRSNAQIRWTRTWVNVREDRTVNSPVVLVLDPGVPVEVGNRQGAWWEAHVDGKVVGYMSNAVLSEEPETD